MAKETQRGLILQPGALGDCILTLPLVRLMKETLDLGGVDLIGHAEYIGMLPGRSCVDSIRSIDSAQLHRLFVASSHFDLADADPLINVFADYSWIVTFLGEPNSDFEKNLIFTTNCSHSAEIITLSLKPPEDIQQHVADYYTRQFTSETGLTPKPAREPAPEVLIRVTPADRSQGLELLDRAGIDVAKKLVTIHPGSGGAHKCWNVENFLAIARELYSMETDVLFLLGPAEMERFGPADMERLEGVATCMTQLSLTEVIALLSCSDAFVGNDSGVTHLAAGMGLRTYAMFGPTDPAQYKPMGPALTVLRDDSSSFAESPSPNLQKMLLDSLTAR